MSEGKRGSFNFPFIGDTNLSCLQTKGGGQGTGRVLQILTGGKGMNSFGVPGNHTDALAHWYLVIKKGEGWDERTEKERVPHFIGTGIATTELKVVGLQQRDRRRKSEVPIPKTAKKVEVSWGVKKET